MQSVVQMEANEVEAGWHLGTCYWLYVVFDCAAAEPAPGAGAQPVGATSLIEPTDQT